MVKDFLDFAASRHHSQQIMDFELNRVRYFWGRVSNFDQSEARKQCILASDWLEFETLPRKYRTLLSTEFSGRVSNFSQSEERNQCFLASDWMMYLRPFPVNSVLYHLLTL